MMHAHAFSSAISGVLYAEDFDEPLLPAARGGSDPAPAIAEPELIEPLFSLDELRVATEEAHENGREVERRAAALSNETRRGAALAALAEQIALTRAQCAEQIEQALDAIAGTTLSLLAAALPALCAARAPDELRAMLRRVLPPARQAPELQIRVHPSLREAIERETAALLDGSAARVAWMNSAKLLPGDIEISWQNGAALRDTAATCAAIRNTVLALFDDGHGILAPETSDGQ